VAGISTAAGNSLLDHILSTAAWTIPPACYISCHTADPGLAGGSEVVGGSYARQGDTAFDAAAARTTANTGAVTWVDMPAVTVTHVGAWDSVGGGVFLAGGALSTQQVLNAGDTLTINAGDLDVNTV